MTAPETRPSEPLALDAALRGAGGWARPEIEMDLAVLARLRDLSLSMAMAVADEAQGRRAAAVEAASVPEVQAADLSAGALAEAEPPPPPIFTGDPMLAFDRAARAVRMTVAVRTRLIVELDRLDVLQSQRAEDRAADLRVERKAQIARLLTRAILEQAPGAEDYGVDWTDHVPDAPELGEIGEAGDLGDNGERLETEGELSLRLMCEASRFLADPDRWGDVLARPASDYIDATLRHIGLSPDWRRLAEEAWAKEELASGRAGAALLQAQCSAHPREGGDPGLLSSSVERADKLRQRKRSQYAAHPRAGGDPGLLSSSAGRADRPLQRNRPTPEPPEKAWVPACAGMSGEGRAEPTIPPPQPDLSAVASAQAEPIIGLPGEYPPPRRPPRPRPPPLAEFPLSSEW